MRRWLVMAVLLVAACRKAPSTSVPGCAAPVEPTTGLRVEHAAGPDGCVTLVRVDPRHFRFRLLTALADGGSRAAPDWAHDFGLTGLINASMYAPDQRSIGILVAGPTVNRERDNEKLGAFLAFDPIDEKDVPLVLTGRDCPGFDLPALRRRYRSIVQNYRLLGCDGEPLPWKDPRRFSAAAVGVDRDGRAVLVHARTPAAMSDFARFLGAQGLRAAMYVEGGPQASLYVRAASTEVAEMGTGLIDNTSFFNIPNVLGFMPRED